MFKSKMFLSSMNILSSFFCYNMLVEYIGPFISALKIFFLDWCSHFEHCIIVEFIALLS